MRCTVREEAIDSGIVQRVLSGAAWRLYQGMPLGDRLHAQKVLMALREKGLGSRDLEQAALLHDVGKSMATLSLVHRVLIVLIEGLDKRLLERLADSNPLSWRYPFYVHLRHAELGASLCLEAGCSPLTVALVRHHDSRLVPPDSPAGLRIGLLELQEADDRC